MMTTGVLPIANTPIVNTSSLNNIHDLGDPIRGLAFRDFSGITDRSDSSLRDGARPSSLGIVEETNHCQMAVGQTHATGIGAYQELPSYGHLKPLLDTLRFPENGRHESDIRIASPETCQWFLNRPEYQAWLNPKKQTEHHGCFWIKGKPGTGKSTIMKFILSRARASRKMALTSSFFFTARGEYLEKSAAGLFRSLLLQLLEGYPILQTILDEPDLRPGSQYSCPSLDTLQTLFKMAVCALGQRPFTCFVDALDECDERQAMDLFEYFEKLGKFTTQRRIPFRICFSSRHYPHFYMTQGLQITLEQQLGHRDGLAIYTKSHLRVGEPALSRELQCTIVRKAAGVFLWVVLVVETLNNEYRRGGLALRKKLAEVPGTLAELVVSMVKRDSDNMEDMLLCILWVLFSKQPLRPEELYHAIWSGLSAKDMVDSEVPDMTTPEADNNMHRYILSSSKGLVEITNPTQPTVQFIHQSVHDFFVKGNTLHEIWPDLGVEWESRSHERLKQCCNSYINHPSVRAAVNSQTSDAGASEQAQILKKYPFLEYAGMQIFYHSDAAASAVPQDKFLSGFSVSYWTSTIKIFGKAKIHEYSRGMNLFYYLAEEGHSNLIRTMLQNEPLFHISGDQYGYPLLEALAKGDKDTVAALLTSHLSIYGEIDTIDDLGCWKSTEQCRKQTPLCWASQCGQVGIVKLLLEKGVSANEKGGDGHVPVLLASANGHESVVRLLLESGADINHVRYGQSPLLLASKNSHKAVVELLLDNGADVNVGDAALRTPLLFASQNGHEALVRLLIENGACVNVKDFLQRTPLIWASIYGYLEVARLLTENGADTKASDAGGLTPLLWASIFGHGGVVKLLLEQGVIVNSRDTNGFTSLYWASQKGHKKLVELLIAAGAGY
jgi:ankyrin repeat protein